MKRGDFQQPDGSWNCWRLIGDARGGASVTSALIMNASTCSQHQIYKIKVKSFNYKTEMADWRCNIAHSEGSLNLKPI